MKEWGWTKTYLRLTDFFLMSAPNKEKSVQGSVPQVRTPCPGFLELYTLYTESRLATKRYNHLSKAETISKLTAQFKICKKKYFFAKIMISTLQVNVRTLDMLSELRAPYPIVAWFLVDLNFWKTMPVIVYSKLTRWH